MLKNGEMPPPRMCILYPTYGCNHRCLGCDYSADNSKGKFFTAEELNHTIDELLSIGIQSVEFCGGGEPTLHPQFTEALDRFVEHKTAFGLLTNGTHLSPEIKRRLVDHGFYCRISVEAGSREVFEQYKRPKSANVGFDAVIENIREIVSMRNSKGPDSRLQISYKYAVDMNNHSDVFKAVDIAYELGVDSIQFKCIRNVPSEIKDPSMIEELKAGFSKCKDRYQDFRIIDNLEKSRLRTGRCWLSPLQLTVDPYGDVYICCYYRHRKDKHLLGNLLERSLKDVWYSNNHWEQIDQIELEDCNKYDCRFHHYNDLMHELVIKDTGQLCFI
jgi:radical SAM protein with 4Fe4S-binding SPASM domain